MHTFNQKLVAVGAARSPAFLFEGPAQGDTVARHRPAPAQQHSKVGAPTDEQAATWFAVTATLAAAVMWSAVILVLATSLEVPSLF